MFPQHIKHKTSSKKDGNQDFRFGAKEEVLKDRVSFLETLSLDTYPIAEMSVQHSDSIAIVTRHHSRCFNVDALITPEKNLVLFLLTADCLPISFYDPTHEVIALAHLGWRPTSLSLSKRVVTKMSKNYSTDPKDLLVHIGPGIHKESYIKRDPAQKDDPRWDPYLKEVSEDHYEVDILQFNVDQLIEVGISKKHIAIDDTDTAKDTEMFSHYRSKLLDEPEGRMATILANVETI